ncbi:MAG: carbohydrate kinase family protein [Ignavibacteriae bacterium]|nr:carbohydrate kinase family protein [Ignavibacteriota bacterium]
MKITVIGHLCLDVIHHADGTETQSYGGIFFSVATLANVLSESDVVFPVFGVGDKEYEEFVERLKQYPNVDTSGVYKFSGPTNQVHLYYKDGGERVECSKHISEPIPWKKIKSKLAVDMVLLNMISGFDITLETLDEIRMELRDDHIPLAMDVHSLSLGIKDDFTRVRRPLEAWRRWLFMLHAVQMNEQEAAGFTTEKFDETTLAKQILALNTKVLTITRGERGFSSFIDDRKHVKQVDSAGITPELAKDSTGCGDVFIAAYCAKYLYSKNIQESLDFANRVAAKKAQYSGSVEIDVLKEFRLVTQTREVAV